MSEVSLESTTRSSQCISLNIDWKGAQNQGTICQMGHVILIVVVTMVTGIFGCLDRALAQQELDLELVLAVDVSLSMDEREQFLQRIGYAEAFRDPLVLKAIQSGGYGRIAVAYMEWAGTGSQTIIADWSIIHDAQSANIFAEILEAAPLTRRRRTSISNGLSAAAAMFDANDYQGLRRVIDISGDGPNNQGVAVNDVRDQLVEQGITINGLPLLLGRGGSGFFDIEDLDRYYADCVIGGFGAFVLPVHDIAKFGEAVRQKLVLEIAGFAPIVHRAQVSRPLPVPTDCLIGEKMWHEWGDRGFNLP